MRGRRERHGVQVIARAAAVLRALEGQIAGMSLGEIAQRVDLPRSTVQRIVNALAEEELIMAASPSARVRLGPALLRLASGAKLEIVETARPYIEALSAELRETVDLAILVGHEAVFVDHVVAPRRLRLVSDIGVHFPLHCTANGKAMLSLLADDNVRALLAPRLKQHTRYTITSFARFMKELESVRAGGIAYDREEHTEGICAVGAALSDQSGTIAAISIPVPATRFHGHEERLVKALSRCMTDLAYGANGAAGVPRPMLASFRTRRDRHARR